MSDRELLEMAAKAAGVEYDPKQLSQFGLWLVIHGEPSEYQRRYWNPLKDDGDALRLAVKIGISKTLLLEVGCGGVDCEFQRCTAQAFYSHDGDPYAATRRAIVRAAAEIGKAMLTTPPRRRKEIDG